MQASRLLSILMLLQTRGRMSARALAAELEVAVRTIHRDIDRLSAAGVPVWGDRGHGGGFQLQPGWRTQLTGLTTDEAQAVFLAGLPGPAAELGLGEAMASAQLKLLAALPAGWQENAQRVGARFHLDPLDWYRDAAPVDHLPAVARAVWQSLRITMRYESWTQTAEREVDPLGLVLKAGTWYMAARSGGKVRSYRLSSILALSVTESAFEPPRDFDLAAYWRESSQRFEAGLYTGEASLRVSERGLWSLQRGSAAVARAAQRSKRRDGEAWQVTIPTESIEHAAGQVIALGAEAEVLAPAALRRRVAERVRALAALYLNE